MAIFGRLTAWARRHLVPLVGAALVGTVLLYAGYQRGYEQGRADAPQQTDTVRAETADPDTSAQLWMPQTLTLYDTTRITETRVDTFRVPVGFDMGGVVSERPVRRRTPLFGPDELVLTTYDTQAQRYEQRTYKVGRSDWGVWPEVEIRTTPEGLYAAGEVGVRYRKVTVTAGYAAIGDGRGVTAGLSFRPFTITL